MTFCIKRLEQLMDDRLKISVIIPVFNCEKYLGEAIQSVIDQTYQLYEIIVVNDGSTDKSSSVAKSFSINVKLFNKDNGGTATAINYGVKRSKGNFLAFLDADDIWLPEKLEKQAKYLIDHPDVDCVYCNAIQFISPELDEVEKVKLECPTNPMPATTAPAIMIRKESFKKVGSLNEGLYIGEFMDWYIRSQDAGLNQYILEDVLVKRRLHIANKSRTNIEDKRRAVLKIAHAAVVKRRESEK